MSGSLEALSTLFHAAWEGAREEQDAYGDYCSESVAEAGASAFYSGGGIEGAYDAMNGQRSRIGNAPRYGFEIEDRIVMDADLLRRQPALEARLADTDLPF